MEPESSLPCSQEPAHLSLSWARLIQSTWSQPTYFRSSLRSSSHLCLVFSSGLFPSGFPTRTLYIPLLSNKRATCPAHVILLDLSTWITFGEIHITNLLQPSVTSSLLDPNILLSTLFSDTLSLCSYLNVRDQVSQLTKKTDKIILLYILIFIFCDSQLEDKRFRTECLQAFPYFNLLLISSWMEFWFVRVVPKYVSFATLSKDFFPIFIS